LHPCLFYKPWFVQGMQIAPLPCTNHGLYNPKPWVPSSAGRVQETASLPLLLLSLPPTSVLFSRSRSRSCVLSLSLLSRARGSHSRVFSLSLSLSLSSPCTCVLSPSLTSLAPFLHACLLSLSRFSRSLSRVFSPLVLSLSLLSRTRVSQSRVFSLSLSLSLSSLSLSIPLVLVAAQGPPTSPAVPCLARRTQYHRSAPSAGRHSASHRVRHATSRRCRAMSRAVYPVTSFLPFRRPSLRTPSRPLRHVASLPGPAGYTPPLDGIR